MGIQSDAHFHLKRIRQTIESLLRSVALLFTTGAKPKILHCSADRKRARPAPSSVFFDVVEEVSDILI
jgi:hypothetical protein